MSASSVSIMATNPEARQRAVKKATTAIEMLPTDVAVSPAGTAGEGRQPSSVREGRDLSHQSIRAGAVLRGTSNDLVPAKKASAGGGDSTAAPQRRTRKLVPKAKKPRWLTVLSVMGKNIGLWIVVWCLFQLIRMLVAKPGNAGMVSGDGAGVAGGYALAEFEGRIADIDDLLRMVQKRVDVVDKKIEEKGAALEKELKRLERLEKLEAASKKLEGNLATLKAKDWIQKGELDKVVEGLKKVKASGGLDIDEVKEFARKMIEEGIDKHAADGIGMVDYALASGGAAVVKHSEPFDVGGRGNWFSLSAKNGVHPNAEKMLKPSFGEPGQCFPLKDSSGFVQIRLRTAIVPEAITLEHVAKRSFGGFFQSLKNLIFRLPNLRALHMTDQVLRKTAGSPVGYRGVIWIPLFIQRGCFSYQNSHMTLTRAMLKLSSCWTQQVLLLSTQYGSILPQTMEALHTLVYIA
ncbi:protein SAD1/UNC-84 domain protein 1 isoform X1 [Arachis ipaensis]|uniref:protein SAD1/UNC-84 domain protein 1 isoform X1 n=1 Tax=Arachis ipaensis TaxID=130454 RepID=UPI000A2B2F78|nr:protein SAD1/UNC-84 domain protein 1 isoform X1 [Arachis ipaensis]XP_025629389.1 SUN domain-containing protein 1 isoform X1 [Arachis hypogaea]